MDKMKYWLASLLPLLFAGLALTACGDDEDETFSDSPVVGSWAVGTGILTFQTNGTGTFTGYAVDGEDFSIAKTRSTATSGLTVVTFTWTYDATDNELAITLNGKEQVFEVSVTDKWLTLTDEEGDETLLRKVTFASGGSGISASQLKGTWAYSYTETDDVGNKGVAKDTLKITDNEMAFSEYETWDNLDVYTELTKYAYQYEPAISLVLATCTYSYASDGSAEDVGAVGGFFVLSASDDKLVIFDGEEEQTWTKAH